MKARSELGRMLYMHGRTKTLWLRPNLIDDNRVNTWRWAGGQVQESWYATVNQNYYRLSMEDMGVWKNTILTLTDIPKLPERDMKLILTESTRVYVSNVSDLYMLETKSGHPLMFLSYAPKRSTTLTLLDVNEMVLFKRSNQFHRFKDTAIAESDHVEFDLGEADEDLGEDLLDGSIDWLNELIANMVPPEPPDISETESLGSTSLGLATTAVMSSEFNPVVSVVLDWDRDMRGVKITMPTTLLESKVYGLGSTNAIDELYYDIQELQDLDRDWLMSLIGAALCNFRSTMG